MRESNLSDTAPCLRCTRIAFGDPLNVVSDGFFVRSRRSCQVGRESHQFAGLRLSDDGDRSRDPVRDTSTIEVRP